MKSYNESTVVSGSLLAGHIRLQAGKILPIRSRFGNGANRQFQLALCHMCQQHSGFIGRYAGAIVLALLACLSLQTAHGSLYRSAQRRICHGRGESAQA